MRRLRDALLAGGPASLLVASLITAVSAASGAPVPLSGLRCEAGEELARLRGEDLRTDTFVYQGGYLVQNRHGAMVNKVWDLRDPRAPALVRTYASEDAARDGDGAFPGGWVGHHVITFLGQVVNLNWDGGTQGQIDLSGLPDLRSPATPPYRAVDDGNRRLYYPWLFQGVPQAYSYDQRAVLTVHDLRDPASPALGELPVLAETGFEGRPNLIGDLLIITGDNEQPEGVATYDLSDPAHPKLLDSIRTTADGLPLIKAYDSVPVWGHYALLIQNGDTTRQRGVDVIDFADPRHLRHVGRFDFPGRTRYAQFQDEYMFVGDAKVDMRTFQVVQTFPDGGGEYNLPVGNLLVTAGMDRPDTGRIWCQQAEPDRRPPMVSFHSPGDGETGVARTGRVGLVIPETLDVSTVNTDNVSLRARDGGLVPADLVYTDHDVLNLTPRAPLAENTTYDLVIRAGGLKDVAGNALPRDYRFSFSTGAQVHSDPPPHIDDLTLSDPVLDQGQTLTLAVSAHDPAGERLRYRATWGDGAEQTSKRATFAHVYEQPGVYEVHVEVADPAGNTHARVATVVVRAAHSAVGRSSSSIALDSARGRVWVVNPDDDTVSALDLDSGERLLEVAVPADPRGVALRGEEVWVLSHDDAAITVLSAADGAPLATIPLRPGGQPVGLVLSPDSSTAYVSAMAEGRLYRVDASSRAVTGALEVGPWPRALAITADGRTLLATRFLSPDSGGQVYRIDTRTFTRTAVLSLAVDRDSVDSDRSGRGLPNLLASIAVAPDGRTVWVGSKKDNILRGLARDGRPLTFESTSRAILSFLDLKTNAEIPGARIDVDNHELPSAIAFGPEGGVAYVAWQGDNEITAFRVRDLQTLDRVTVGRAPQGLAVDGAGRVWAQSLMSRSVARLDLFSGPDGSLGRLRVDWERPSTDIERLSPEVLYGKQLFYDASDRRISLDGYLSCASCHPDGGHDGRVWDFTSRGEGLRNTVSLNGHGQGQGRWHWSANFDEVQDFEHDMRNAFGGTGLLDRDAFRRVGTPLGTPKAGLSAELDALAAYVGSLTGVGTSPFRAEGGGLTEAGLRGRQVFQEAGCGRCHGGPAFTDSALGGRHDVGTLSATSGRRLGGALLGLDTPTLRGLWNTAPYLHDGSAPTLDEILTRQDHAPPLSDADRAALVAYLLQLDDAEPGPPASSPALQVTGPAEGAVLDGRLVTLGVETTLPDLSEVVWMADGVEIGRRQAAPWTVPWRPTLSGELRLTALATYNRGATRSLSPERSVHVRIDATAPKRPGLTLLWQDDFDAWADARWSSGAYALDDSDAQFSGDAVRLAGGTVTLSITRSELPTPDRRPAISGDLRTNTTFLYGRFEARARLPAGGGVVSTFQLFYNFFANPALERDWNLLNLEAWGVDPRRIHASVVHQEPSRPYISEGAAAALPADASEAFHVYAIDWRPTSIDLYVDEVRVYSAPAATVPYLRHPATLIFQLWPVRATSPRAGELGAFDLNAAPVSMQLDWVRVYTLAP